jgi:hypothetical protein
MAVLPKREKVNIPVKQKKQEESKVDRGPSTELRHVCECMCLKNIPGYPYRLGYAKRYADSQNKARCSYCNCLALDYEPL